MDRLGCRPALPLFDAVPSGDHPWSLDHMSLPTYGYQFATPAVWGVWMSGALEIDVGPPHALEVGGRCQYQRRNKMLGLGLLGTIIVICLVVWLIRRVV
jgi:hypothetical protein